MTNERLQEVFEFYQKYFVKNKIPPRGLSETGKTTTIRCPSRAVELAHSVVKDMIYVRKFSHEDENGFSNALYFVQGILLTTGHFTLEELKNHQEGKFKKRRRKKCKAKNRKR